MYLSRNLVLVSAVSAVLISIVFGQNVELDSNPPVNPGSDIFEERKRANCELTNRNLDGVCTNPTDSLYGSANRPVFSYVDDQTSVNPTGAGRPSARVVSNTICDQPDDVDVRNDRNVNELFVFFGQFIDHNLVSSVAGDDPNDMPIPIPADDEDFPNDQFPANEFVFTRNSRGIVEGPGGLERPQNSISQILDLSAVYGSDEERGEALRDPNDNQGRLLVSAGNLLPLNTFGLENPPDAESEDFFIGGDTRVNEHPMLTVMHTIWVREHNNIIDELVEDRIFARLSSDGLYQLARRINIAQFQKIVYDEFIPAIVGRSLPAYTGFDPDVDPTVSNIFSTAAFRVGHTMVGNGVQLAGPGNVAMTPLPLAEMFFREADVIQSRGIDVFLRGAISTVAQEVDELVVDALRNFLFTNVEDEEGLDLISLNIQRGRDHAIPTYNEIRVICGLRPVRSFAGITSNRPLRAAFESIYDSVDDVDAWVGLVAEDHVRRSSFGETMRAVWEKEFTRLRDGDQFFYLRDGQIDTQLRSIPRVRDLFRNRGSTFRRIILRNTGVRRSEIASRVFFAP